MKTVTMIMFGDEERRAFERLDAYRCTLGFDDDDKPVLGRLLNRVTARVTGDEFDERFTEPLDVEFLRRLEDALARLHDEFVPQQDAAWWFERAPRLRSGERLGSATTWDGLALSRKHAVEEIDAALKIVKQAIIAALYAVATEPHTVVG